MSSGPTLSRYTPSVMGRDLLERLFVARDRLLDEVVRRVDAASTSTERNHTLLVGPRGSGKTHLVSLVAHRTRDLMAEGRQVQLAWLPEDPWTLVTYRHLLAEVVSRLEPPFEGDVPRRPDELEAILAQRADQHGPAIVIAENLDQILEAIGNDGQQRLRHLLQTDRSLLLAATSTTLDRSMSDQASPFYGFFTTSRLEPFDVDEAAAMLTAIAVEREDDALVDYLASDEGRARLRTIEHLAGGQPRMWAALASALTVDGLDDLVDLLLTRFDDLTPYYQEQLGRLSGQQRLVVAELAEVDRPITVKELAERLEIDQRSLGKTVSDLVDRRWMAETTSPVTAMLDRRRTYYELAEPMARLSFQIKDNRGEPLRVIVDFLKHWFDPEDLRIDDVLNTSERMTSSVERYLALAAAAQRGDELVAATRHLAGLPQAGGSALPALARIDDALRDLAADSADRFLELPSPIRSAIEDRLASEDLTAVRLAVQESALTEAAAALTPLAQQWIHRASRLVEVGGELLPRSQAGLVRWLAKAGEYPDAKQVLRAISAPTSTLERLSYLHALIGLMNSTLEVGDLRDALDIVRVVLRELRQISSELPSTRVTELKEVLDSERLSFESVVSGVEVLAAKDNLPLALSTALPESLTLCLTLVGEMWAQGNEAAAEVEKQILAYVESNFDQSDPVTKAVAETVAAFRDGLRRS